MIVILPDLIALVQYQLLAISNRSSKIKYLFILNDLYNRLSKYFAIRQE